VGNECLSAASFRLAGAENEARDGSVHRGGVNLLALAQQILGLFLRCSRFGFAGI